MQNGIKFPIALFSQCTKTLFNCTLPVLKDLAANGKLESIVFLGNCH